MNNLHSTWFMKTFLVVIERDVGVVRAVGEVILEGGREGKRRSYTICLY